MFANILKSNQPFVIVFIVIAGALLWMYSIIDPIAISIPSDALSMPFYSWIGQMADYNSIYSVILTYVLVLIQAFLLVQFNKRHIVINYTTYLPAFFYILLASSVAQLQRLNPVIIGVLFIFIAVNFMYSTYRTEYALNKLYLAGFFVSIASLFWAPLAIFILIIWISLVILRPFIGREWIVGALGFLTPYLFVFTYYFVFKEEQLQIFIGNFYSSFFLIKNFYALHLSYYLFFAFLALILIIASYVIVNNLQKKKIKNRKFFTINWWVFFISIIMFVVLRNVSYEIMYLMSLPIAFLLTDYMYTIKRNIYSNIILVIFIGLIVYIQIAAH